MSLIGKIIGDTLGTITTPIVDYLKTRSEDAARLRLRKIELQDAISARKVELVKQGLMADMSWEQTFAEQAASSWKDEYTLLVVSIPAILAFIRIDGYINGPAIVSAGFDALGKTPMWYQMVLISLFLATVGIRYWRRNQSDT
jgi:hypothetical protein